jgi:hypothetical protein
VDQAGCPAFITGLINMFVFNILQIPSWCIQICNEFTSTLAVIFTRAAITSLYTSGRVPLIAKLSELFRIS